MTDIQTQGEDPIAMLVERLREMRGEEVEPGYVTYDPLCQEAADALLSLSQERDRLREALEPFATLAGSYDPDEGDSDQLAWGNNTTTIGDLRRARAALQKEGA